MNRLLPAEMRVERNMTTREKINIICKHVAGHHQIRDYEKVFQRKINGHMIKVKFYYLPSTQDFCIMITIYGIDHNITAYEFSDPFKDFFNQNVMPLEEFLYEIIYELL